MAGNSDVACGELDPAPVTSAKVLKRACVGMDSPITHLRAACTEMARSGFRYLTAPFSRAHRGQNGEHYPSSTKLKK